MAVRVNVRLSINDGSGRRVEFAAQGATTASEESDVLEPENRAGSPNDQVLPAGSSTLAPGLSLPIA